MLDVNELEVDKLTLEVDDLRAHVSLMAELANLLRLSVGVDATRLIMVLGISGGPQRHSTSAGGKER